METEEKAVLEKKEKNSSDLRRALIFCLVWSVLFLFLSMAAESAGIELRAWCHNFSCVILLYGLPVTACAWGIGKILEKTGRKEEKKAAGGGCITALLLVFVLYLAVAGRFGFGKNFFEKETKLSNSVILTEKNAANLRGGVSGAYYRPVALLFRQEYAYDDTRVVQAVLAQRYGEEFTVGNAGSANAYAVAAKLCSAVPKGKEEPVFHVLINYANFPYYTDDYTVARQNWKAMEYLEKYWPDREIVTEEKGSSGLERELALICRPETDFDGLAECMAGMIACVLEDSFFNEHGGSFQIVYMDDTGKKGKSEFPFGFHYANKGTPTWHSRDFYADPQNVRSEMNAWVSEWEDAREKNGEEVAEGSDAADGDKTEVWTEPFENEQGLLTAEGAYQKLYEDVFAPDGYSSETTYNAKGNFYAILSKKEDTSGGAVYRTVVYNRKSVNGKCHIFVYYNRSGQNERIMEFYAVDEETGRVTAGNKKAWDQVASKEYQEATGEK